MTRRSSFGSASSISASGRTRKPKFLSRGPPATSPSASLARSVRLGSDSGANGMCPSFIRRTSRMFAARLSRCCDSFRASASSSEIDASPLSAASISML